MSKWAWAIYFVCEIVGVLLVALWFWALLRTLRIGLGA